MVLGSAKLVELKGTRRDLDEVENGELEEVELALKEAKRRALAVTTDYDLSGPCHCYLLHHNTFLFLS